MKISCLTLMVLGCSIPNLNDVPDTQACTDGCVAAAEDCLGSADAEVDVCLKYDYGPTTDFYQRQCLQEQVKASTACVTGMAACFSICIGKTERAIKGLK